MVPDQRFLDAFTLFLLFQLCTSTDTISPTRSITDGETLVSNGNKFALGFFSPGNSKNRYVGIWYKNIPEQTVVWVANRENPIQDSSGVLTIYGDGNLVVVEGDRKKPLWSTNVSTVTNDSTAKLLDSGNLVLRSSPGNRVVWESFDYPTDTALPGMKMGVNRKAGRNWSLTSWKSSDDPACGDYSTGVDQRGLPQFFHYNGSAPYWRSGPWDGLAFSGLPGMSEGYIFRYIFVNNDDEIYSMYTINNSSIISRFVLDVSGLSQRLTWNDRNRWNLFWSLPLDSCDYYGLCGAFGSCNSDTASKCQCLPGFEPRSTGDWYLRDWSGGCVRKRRLECGKGDGFLKLEQVKVPDTSIARVDMNLSLKDCEKECLRNCFCTGDTSANISGEGSGCVAWYGDLMDMRELSGKGQDFFLRVDAAELAKARRDSKGFLGDKRMVVILVTAILGVLFLVLCGCYLLKKNKTKGAAKKRQHRKLFLFDFATRSLSFKESSGANDLGDSRTNPQLPVFELNAIASATNNFSLGNKLGQGGFGSVYKGRLSNGQEIAVKRLSKNSGQGIEEFKNEVMLIAKLQHRNLVRLLGCCIQEEEKMLIYEYMPNKSLDTLIFDQRRRASLDWRTCFEIIVGIARGILYLHQDSRLKIIHRDLKASNVLLDAEMTPKISDFGMARIFGGNQTQANTNRVVGTYGYMSPEYAMAGLFSTKSDVFSFGVLLLEIITGKKNNYYHDDPCLNLTEHAWDLWSEGKVQDIVDSSIGNLCPTHEVLRCIQVGLLCVQESASDRPTMSSVVFMLSNETTMPPPKRPAFVLRKMVNDPDSSYNIAGYCSINEVTITVVEPR